jgi:hypothetical protein
MTQGILICVASVERATTKQGRALSARRLLG